MSTKDQITAVISSHRKELKRFKVLSIALFGSYARNEQRPESDIDLLVGFDETASLFDFIDLGDYLSGLLHCKVDVVSPKGLSQYIGPYIVKEAIPIV